MTEKQPEPLLPVIKERRGPSIVWLIPLLTLVIGLWLVGKTIAEQGPQITITFRTAEGIEAGKTPIKYKDMKIGIVESLRFGEGYDHVELTARLDPEAEVFLHRDTRFWVVRPRLSLRGATGLGTLVSGNYIEIDPGHGSAQKHFIGLDDAPVIKSDTDGVRVTLLSEKLGSLDIGSPVYYQGIQAGEVLGYELANDQHSVLIHAFIKAPYNELVHGNSHFWNISGIDLSVGADGFQLHTQSLQSMVYGGIAFDSRQSADSPDEEITALVFSLYANYDEIIEKAYTRKMRFVVFFDSSVRGLEPGAPVEFKGIRVGSVAEVSLEFDSKDITFQIPVIIELEPERIVDRAQSEGHSAYQTVKTLIERGLRAQLQTGSLLTGKLYVALDMHPESPLTLTADNSSPLPEIPSMPGGFDQITTSLTSILGKLEKVQTDKIGDELLGLMQGANGMVNSPGMQQSAGDLRASLAAFRHVLEALDKRSEPMAENLDKALLYGQQTLDNLNRVLDPASPAQFQFNRLSKDLSEMARAIRSFVDVLERNPNAAIFGKRESGEP